MRFLCSLALVLGTASAAYAEFTTVNDAERFRDLVNGKVLTRPLVQLRVSPSGQIQGTGAARAVQGQWRWANGFFCRDLRWGERDLGYNCQMVQVNGSKIRFTSDRGRGDFADFRLKPN